MIIHFHARFTKRIGNLHAGERARLNERLALFEKNPYHPILGNHTLSGRYTGHQSIDITGSLRAVYWPIADDEVLFAFLGTHPELYG